MLLIAAAILIVITALLHSILGELRLIIPILSSDIALAKHEVARPIIRFAWHLTSFLWLILAVFLAKSGVYGIGNNFDIIAIIGVFHILCGLFDGLITKGKHVGWLPITLIGICALSGLYF